MWGGKTFFRDEASKMNCNKVLSSLSPGFPPSFNPIPHLLLKTQEPGNREHPTVQKAEAACPGPPGQPHNTERGRPAPSPLQPAARLSFGFFKCLALPHTNLCHQQQLPRPSCPTSCDPLFLHRPHLSSQVSSLICTYSPGIILIGSSKVEKAAKCLNFTAFIYSFIMQTSPFPPRNSQY